MIIKNQSFTTFNKFENKVYEEEYTFINCEFSYQEDRFISGSNTFINCIFSKCDFGIDSIEGNFENTKFEKVTFTNVYFSEVEFKECKFISCEFGNNYSVPDYNKCKVDLTKLKGPFDKLEKELVIHQNLSSELFIINSSPLSNRWCILNLGQKIEIFYYLNKTKNLLTQFTDIETSIEHFKSINFLIDPEL